MKIWNKLVTEIVFLQVYRGWGGDRNEDKICKAAGMQWVGTVTTEMEYGQKKSSRSSVPSTTSWTASKSEPLIGGV